MKIKYISKEAAEYYRDVVKDRVNYTGHIWLFDGDNPNIWYLFKADNVNANLKKIRVRELKDGWYLYLPEPDYVENDEKFNEFDEYKEACDEKELNDDSPTMPISKEDFECINYLVDLLKDTIIEINRLGRPVEIIKKKKNKTVFEYGHFHGWFNNTIAKEDGTIVTDLLAIVEYYDGHVERNRFDTIRFLDCVDAETKMG